MSALERFARALDALLDRVDAVADRIASLVRVSGPTGRLVVYAVTVVACWLLPRVVAAVVALIAIVASMRILTDVGREDGERW